MEFRSTLLDPIYTILGVAATLTPRVGSATPLVAIDKTAGVQLGGAVDVLTTVPAATVRVYEMAAAGLSPDDCDGGTLLLNSKVWRVTHHQLRPTPRGEDDGEVMLILEA